MLNALFRQYPAGIKTKHVCTGENSKSVTGKTALSKTAAPAALELVFGEEELIRVSYYKDIL